MKDSTLAKLKEHKISIKKFEEFKQKFYRAFPVDDTTVLQHFLQKEGIKVEFPEYRVRGTPCKIRNLATENNKFTGDLYSPTITVAIGAEVAEPKEYDGCPEDRCFAGVVEGNCTSKMHSHGFVGETNLPRYTTRFYMVSDGETERDRVPVTLRHDVHDGQPIEGVWKLKGMVTDGGFYAWAGIPLSQEAIEEWGADDSSMNIVAPEDSDVDEPDLSYLEESSDSEVVEKSSEIPEDWDQISEEDSPKIPEDLSKQFFNIVKNEERISKNKVKTWLQNKGMSDMYEPLLKKFSDSIKEDGDDLIWQQKKEKDSQ